jgi:hypothetical protein
MPKRKSIGFLGLPISELHTTDLVGEFHTRLVTSQEQVFDLRSLLVDLSDSQLVSFAASCLNEVRHSLHATNKREIDTRLIVALEQIIERKFEKEGRLKW